MEFEVFSKDLLALRRQPTITIQKNGIISLNRTAYTSLERPDAVELLFDGGSRTIGLRRTDPGVEHAVAVRTLGSRDTGPFVVSAMAFIAFYNLGCPVSRRWPAYLDDDVLCLDLDDTPRIVTSNRAHRGS